MQMMKPPKSSAKIVWTYGTICGVCVSMLWLIGGLVLSNTIGDTVWNALRVILGASFLLVGMPASRQTDQMLTGTQAGLVAGLTEGIILDAVNIVITRPNPSLDSVVEGSVVLIGLALGAGAVMGWIGAAIGSITNALIKKKGI